MSNITRESILNIMVVDMIELLVENLYCPKGKELDGCREFYRVSDEEDCKQCISRFFENKSKKYLFEVK